MKLVRDKNRGKKQTIFYMVNSELVKVFPKEVMERRQMVSSGGKEAQINSWPTNIKDRDRGEPLRFLIQ